MKIFKMLTIAILMLSVGCSQQISKMFEKDVQLFTKDFNPIWIPKGVGGGGGLFGPSFNPNNPNEIYINCDMSEVFRSRDGGVSWSMLNWKYIRGQDKMAPIQYTSDPNILYGIDAYQVTKSLDGGETWNPIPAGEPLYIAYAVFSDFSNPARICFSDDKSIYFSTDGGATAKTVYTTSSIHMSGAYFDCSNIIIATSAGLLTSTDNGNSFSILPVTGIPSGEAIVSFTSSKENGNTRFFCVTLNSSAVYPGVMGFEAGNYKAIYRMDYSFSNTWLKATNGIGDNWIDFIAMCSTNNSIVYAAGCTAGGDYPSVVKSIDGGNSWTNTFYRYNNQNIFTGWHGDKRWDDVLRPWQGWDWGAPVLGLSVCPSDSQRAIFTDAGFAHLTTNGGKWWVAIYDNPNDLNTTNKTTPYGGSYRGNGLEPTVGYSLLWVNRTNIFESITDIIGIRSLDGGTTWSFPTGLTMNTTYEAIKHPTNGNLYAAVSEVHCIYTSTRGTMDENIEWGKGTVACSKDNGNSWTNMPNFSYPVMSLAIDPRNHNKMYISGVNHTRGGIFVSSNYQLGKPTWTKVGSPGRTQGHPFIIRVLKDGTLVCSYSGRNNGTTFTASSGVYVSTNNGKAWMDRTNPGMKYWTTDLVIDPNDPNQNIWYAGVCKDEDSSLGIPGLYRTTTRGKSWTKITKNIDSVFSCTVVPGSPNTLFFTTMWEGLWYTTNARAASPQFYPVNSYPFKYPMRVFFNPYNTNEMWVTSCGGGLLMCNPNTISKAVPPSFRTLSPKDKKLEERFSNVPRIYRARSK